MSANCVFYCITIKLITVLNITLFVYNIDELKKLNGKLNFLNIILKKQVCIESRQDEHLERNNTL